MDRPSFRGAAPSGARSCPSARRGSPGTRRRQQAFPKSVRLLRSSDFRTVYDNGTRYACPLFAAFKLRHTGEGQTGNGPRIGFTTPKGLGKAVVRNRIRRRVREAVRLELSSLSPEWSIVFNPRRKALDCLFGELQNEVKRFFNRCNEPPAASSSSSSAGTNS